MSTQVLRLVWINRILKSDSTIFSDKNIPENPKTLWKLVFWNLTPVPYSWLKIMSFCWTQRKAGGILILSLRLVFQTHLQAEKWKVNVVWSILHDKWKPWFKTGFIILSDKNIPQNTKNFWKPFFGIRHRFFALCWNLCHFFKIILGGNEPSSMLCAFCIQTKAVNL